MKSNKPTEAELIAYLYGELEGADEARVEKFLQEHPDELASLQPLKDVRNVMANIRDKEVIAPPIIGEETGGHSIFRSAYFKIPMSIAASLALFLVVARLVGTQIEYSQGSLTIRFGKVVNQNQTASNTLTTEEVEAMINQSLVSNNQMLSASWNEQQQQLQQSIQNNLRFNSKKVDDLIKVASQASQDQIRSFVAGLQSENLQMMKDYLQLSSKDQQKYVEGLLVDFSKYLQEQRKQDLNAFQVRMSNIEQNTNQFKQETEQILASIISNPDNSLKKNSY